MRSAPLFPPFQQPPPHSSTPPEARTQLRPPNVRGAGSGPSPASRQSPPPPHAPHQRSPPPPPPRAGRPAAPPLLRRPRLPPGAAPPAPRWGAALGGAAAARSHWPGRAGSGAGGRRPAPSSVGVAPAAACFRWDGGGGGGGDGPGWRLGAACGAEVGGEGGRGPLALRAALPCRSGPGAGSPPRTAGAKGEEPGCSLASGTGGQAGLGWRLSAAFSVLLPPRPPVRCPLSHLSGGEDRVCLPGCRSPRRYCRPANLAGEPVRHPGRSHWPLPSATCLLLVDARRCTGFL